jgi:hypothetical protein
MTASLCGFCRSARPRTELQEAHFGWQARGDWPRGPARDRLRHDRRRNVVQRACDRPRRLSHPLRRGFVMIALNEALRSIAPPALLLLIFLLPRPMKQQVETLCLRRSPGKPIPSSSTGEESLNSSEPPPNHAIEARNFIRNSKSNEETGAIPV